MPKLHKIFRLRRHATNDFIENRLPGIDPTLQNLPQSQYSDSVSHYLPDEPAGVAEFHKTEEMEQQIHIFQRALENFEQKAGSQTKLSTTAVTSWPDVIRIVDRETEAYRNKGNGDGLKQNIRGLSRRFHEWQHPVESCIKLLPSASWEVSVVCGGLTAVLQAARVLGRMREDTYKAMEEIPSVIGYAHDLLAIYILSNRRNKLEDYVSQMFVAILDFIANTLDWYTKNAARKFVGAMFRGDDYATSVSASIENFKSLFEAVEREGRMNQHLIIKELREEVREEFRSAKQLGAKVANYMRMFLLENEERSKRTMQLEGELQKKEQVLAERENRVFQHEKRMLLDQLPDVLRLEDGDVKECLFVGQALSLDMQDRAAWILQSPNIVSWLCLPEDALLQINGGEADHDGGYSAVSFFSAMLVRALLSTSDDVMVLYWFCGQHVRAGMNDMLQWLIAQLLSRGDDAIICLPDPITGLLEDVEDPERLLRLLRGCVKQQLRSTPVFIVLDSVSFYEDRRRKRSLHRIVEGLAELQACPENGSAWLKILITSPIRCDYSREHGGAPVEVLEVPEFVDGWRQGLTESVLMENINVQTRRVENSLQYR